MSYRPSRAQRIRSALANHSNLLLSHPAAGGLALMCTAALALIVANSPWSGAYAALLAYPLAGISVLHWINDALMAVFFLLVGLEIKRELLSGTLRTWDQRILPGSAALGGMLGPALIYLGFNQGATGAPAGWAIPAATDIAFALGVLSLLGSRVPVSLKVFLTALAILDDLGAVLIIAFFYTQQIQVGALLAAAAMVAVLVLLNRVGHKRLVTYIAIGVVLWIFIFKSGVHATLAGVLVALAVPHRATDGSNTPSPLLKLEHLLAPWVGFLILPVFGFANAGVTLTGISIETVLSPVPLGISTGLFFGKQIGIFVASALVIRLGWATLPASASWGQLYGISVLCGIGFTMSLFIGLLAFPDDLGMQAAVKVGVLCGSLLAALTGAGVLLRVRGRG